MFDPFDFGAVQQYLVGRLTMLPQYNGLRVPPDYFDEAMERMCTRFLNKPLDTVLHPTPLEDRDVVAEKQERAETAPAPEPEQLSAEHFYEMGMTHINNGDNGSAIDAFTEAIRLNPQHAEAYNSRSVAHDLQGNINDAIKNYDNAIRLRPGFAFALFNRATARKAVGDLDGAISDFEMAINSKPDFDAARRELKGARRTKAERDS